VKHPIATIAVSRIHIRGERRPIDQKRVEFLAASIAELGLLNPITITLDDGSKDYWLVAGHNRLAAVVSLGWKEVPTVLLDFGDLLCDLAEIDENLCRLELTPAQRAEVTARRKTIWEALHPETVAGTAGAIASNKVQGKESTQVQNSALASFSQNTAAVTGRSRRSVYLDAQIGAALSESPEAADIVHAAVKPLPQSALLEVARASKDERPAVASAAVEKANAPKPKPVTPPPAPTLGRFSVDVAQVSETEWTATAMKPAPAASGYGKNPGYALVSLGKTLQKLAP
jgi:ParB-like chromosome segregation protein Spo0J